MPRSGSPRRVRLRLVPDAPTQSAFQRAARRLAPYDRDACRGGASAAAGARSRCTRSSASSDKSSPGYIALETEEGLLLIDQHAAHERVTFEKLRRELRDGGIRTQAMLAPVPVELNPARAAQVHGALSELRAMGFEVEPFGPTTLLLKGAPAVFGPRRRRQAARAT